MNGSGKHLNWSFATESANLLEPGDTPHDNMQFLFFCTAVLRAVDRHQDLLRAAVAYAGNDHRLGANEAPPAIISVFLGDQLTDIFEQIERAGTAKTSKQGGLLGLGVADAAAPAASTRAIATARPVRVHGQQVRVPRAGLVAVASRFPATVLNTIVAESIDELVTELEAELAKGDGVRGGAARRCSPTEIRRFKRIIFNGDGYSEEWQQEAERRGLLNLRTTLDALEHAAPGQRT